MSDIQYMSQDKMDALKAELKELKGDKAPQLRKKIDDARQMGDLSENAEYHAAREELAWVQSRINEINFILDDAKVITQDNNFLGFINIGSTIIVKINGKKKEFTIVGAQEANPLLGKISNESPLGSAFLGKKKNDKIEVKTPGGAQIYEIMEIK